MSLNELNRIFARNEKIINEHKEEERKWLEAVLANVKDIPTWIS